MFSHTPIHPLGAVPLGLCWNYEEVMHVIEKQPRGVVVSIMGGHTHENFCTECPKTGALVQTLPSVLECTGEANAYATVEMTRSDMRVNGVGELWSSHIVFPQRE